MEYIQYFKFLSHSHRWWLSEEGHNFLLNNKDEKLIPQLPRRLISDAYICFYSSDVLHYR